MNLELNMYQCFDARCQRQGNVIDLWVALHKMSVRDGTLDLVWAFGLEQAKRFKVRLDGAIAEHRNAHMRMRG
jgi:hypothetical protein